MHDPHTDRRRAHSLLYDGDNDAEAHAHGHGHGHGHGDATAHVPAEAAAPSSVLARAFASSAAAAQGAAAPAYAYAGAGEPHAHHDHQDRDHGHHLRDGEDEHTHIAVVPSQLRQGGWREALSVVVAVGLRPCSGALVVLVFALSQGVLWAGIASVFLMGFGTAITVAMLATFAMFAKGTAQRLSGRRGSIAMRIVWWAELAAAFFVFAFGILLILANLYG
jgi:ABC-type nickel/cobalt efflux system permease component RcnA